MDFFITRATYKLLVFLWIIQEMYGLVVNHSKLETAVEGQNISLPCIVEDPNVFNIIQVEWIKQHKGTDQKIAVFHPRFPIKYFKNNSVLEARHRPETGHLQGSVLYLLEVTVNDSGKYVCETTTYPHGSIKKSTRVTVRGSPSLKMLRSYEFVKEGDEVKIICLANPSPLGYELRRSKDERFLLKSLNGEFVLPNVTRNNSDMYVCFPHWDSSAQHQQGFNTTMELTVNFLDTTECNSSSPLNVTVGGDVTISCKANASQPLKYKWMKGDTTVSSSDTLSLTSVTPDQSGTYKLTAAFQNDQLQTGVEFSVHVFTSEDTDDFATQTTSSLPFQTTEHLRNFTSMETSTWDTGISMTTAKAGYFLTSTAQPNATMTTVETRHTSHDSPLNGSSSAPPVGNASSSQPYVVNPTQTSFTFHVNTTADPPITNKRVTYGSTVTIEKDSKKATYIVFPILLLLLVLIGLLYRRHVTQKRMNMPPPFKPPPPPVKYTSVRNRDVPMTDILV